MSSRDAAEARHEEALMLEARYRETQARVVVAAANMEHALHQAVAAPFNARNEAIDIVLKDVSASHLVKLVRQLYAHVPDVKALCKTIDGLLEKRNTIVHGQAIEFVDFTNLSKSEKRVYNRRKPGKFEAQPSESELDALISSFQQAQEELSSMVENHPLPAEERWD